MPHLIVILFLPLLLIATVSSLTITQAVTAVHVDMQKAVELSARTAAMQVTTDSQAAGRPRIHTSNAHEEFQRSLATNLGLNPATMQPLAGSGFKRPNYILVVYNTDDLYSSSGALRCRKYVFQNGVLNTYTLSPSGQSATFVVTDSDIYLGDTGQIKTTLDRPGTVALVKAEMTRVAGKDPEVVSRWVSSKVVKTAPGPW